MKDEKHLKELVGQVYLLIDKHGPRSEEVRQFVKDHLEVKPELLELSAVIILMFEGKLDGKCEESAETVKNIFSDDPELKED